MSHNVHFLVIYLKKIRVYSLEKRIRQSEHQHLQLGSLFNGRIFKSLKHFHDWKSKLII